MEEYIVSDNLFFLLFSYLRYLPFRRRCDIIYNIVSQSMCCYME